MRLGRRLSVCSSRTAVLTLPATSLVSAAAFVATAPIGLKAGRPAERYPVPEGGRVSRGFYQN
jgi:hypothetical protein